MILIIIFYKYKFKLKNKIIPLDPRQVKIKLIDYLKPNDLLIEKIVKINNEK